MLFSQGVTGALAVLMKDAIKPTLMQTLEVRPLPFSCTPNTQYLLHCCSLVCYFSYSVSHTCKHNCPILMETPKLDSLSVGEVIGYSRHDTENTHSYSNTCTSGFGFGSVGVCLCLSLSHPEHHEKTGNENLTVVKSLIVGMPFISDFKTC